MTLPRDVFVVGAARTAIGSFGGALKDHAPSDLATAVLKAALQRGGVAPEQVGHVTLGMVLITEPRDAFASRVAALGAGLPHTVPAFNVNRLCGSGLQAIVSAAQAVALGDCEVAVGAGAESMSRCAHLLPAARWGARLGDVTAVDLLLHALHDPFHHIHMGMTAENVAAAYGIDRARMDALALDSQRRAAAAIAEGRFKDQIVPLEVRSKRGVQVFDTDEHVRPDTTAQALARLRPAFKPDGGTVTAGNASGLNDGAAAVVLASERAVRAHDLTPLARLVGYAHAGVAPELMGIGPVPATRLALQRCGLRVEQLDVIESNEAFAAQACAVMQELGLDPAKVNPNGSGIALGHPIGATGAVITTKAVYELQRTGGRYALVTMCIGGGQGIAAIFERV
jgi:acetyl-CoA C-acetyltransferase